MQTIFRSDLIRSLAGRDQGKLFYVLETEGAYALIVNGKERKLEHPKRKKLKHICFVTRTESRVAEKLRTGAKVLDRELRRDLAIQAGALCQDQGG